jgi:hypothetical protein
VGVYFRPGEPPDFSCAWVDDPDENNRDVSIAHGKSSDGLLIGGSVLGIAFGAGAEPAHRAHEGTIHQHLQLVRQRGALRLPVHGADLQVIGGGFVVSVLCGLQESQYGP